MRRSWKSWFDGAGLTVLGVFSVLYLAPIVALIWEIIGQVGGVEDVPSGMISVTGSVLWNTVEIAGAVAVLCIVGGGAIATLLSMVGRTLRLSLIVALLSPVFVNQISRNSAWMNLLSREGLLGDLVFGQFAFANKEIGWSLLYNRSAVVMVLVHGFLPIATLALIAAIDAINWEYVDIAYSLGGTRMQVIRRIVVPMVAPGVIVSGGLVFVLSFGYFITPAMLGGRKGMMVAKLVIQELDQMGYILLPYATSALVALIVIPFAVVLGKAFIGRYARI